MKMFMPEGHRHLFTVKLNFVSLILSYQQLVFLSQTKELFGPEVKLLEIVYKNLSGPTATTAQTGQLQIW